MALSEGIAGLQVVVTADTSRAEAGLRRLEQSGKQSGTVLRESMTEGRAAIRQIGEEIGVNLNRHLISFLAKLPGVAPAMAAAFPAAAVVGIGMALFETGKRLAEFIIKSREAASKIGEAFESMHQSSKLATDELIVSTDKAEGQIAKLIGDRPNVLKMLLDEDRVEADKLVKSLEAADKAAEAIMKENNIGAVGGFLTFRQQTGPMGDVIRKQAADLQEIIEKYQAMADGAKTAAEAQKIGADGRGELIGKEKQQLTGLQDYYNYTKRESETPGGALYGGLDYSAELTIVAGRAHQLEDLIRQQEAEARSVAVAARLTDVQSGLETLPARLRSFTMRGTLTEWMRQNAEKYQRSQDRNMPDEVSDQTLGTRMEADLVDHTSERWKAYNDAVRESALLKDKMAQASEQMHIRLAEETGAITRQRAAVLTLRSEIGGYNAEAEDLRAQLKDVSSNRQIPDSDRMAQMQQLQNKLDQVTGAAQLKGMELDAAVRATQLRTQVGEMFQEWINQSTNVGAAVKRSFDQAIGSINEAILKTLTDPYHRGDWKNAGKSVFTGVARSGLEMGEGALMKALGMHGKADGYHVFVDNLGAGGAAGGPGGVLGKVLGMFGPGGGSGAGATAASATASAGSSIFSGLFAGGFAGGGEVPSNMWSVMGEDGIELVPPASHSRTVIPNSAIGGGDTHHHWNIDARGATDPAAVHAAAQRAVMEAVPHIVAASHASHIDHNRRVSSSGRW